MTFTDALAAIFNDRSPATRRKWQSRLVYLKLDQQQRLCTTWYNTEQRVDGFLHPWIMTDEDYFADDWEVVE